MAFASRYDPNAADFYAVRDQMEHGIHGHRGWYIFQGIAFLVFGFLAAVLPGITAVSAALFLGAVLVITGIFQLIASFRAQMHWWSFLSAILSIAIGGWMLWAPIAGTLALVMTVAAFLAIEGIFEILLALEFRPVRNWGWMLVSGIAALALFVLLWLGFPALSIYYLGILIAINFIFYGISLLMLAAVPKRTEK